METPVRYEPTEIRLRRCSWSLKLGVWVTVKIKKQFWPTVGYGRNSKCSFTIVLVTEELVEIEIPVGYEPTEIWLRH